MLAWEGVGMGKKRIAGGGRNECADVVYFIFKKW